MECRSLCQKECQIECQIKYAIYTSRWYIRNYVEKSVSGWGSLEESNSALFFSSRWVSGVWFHQPTIQFFWDKPEGFFSGFLSLIFRGFFSLGRTLHIPELGTRDANLV